MTTAPFTPYLNHVLSNIADARSRALIADAHLAKATRVLEDVAGQYFGEGGNDVLNPRLSPICCTVCRFVYSGPIFHEGTTYLNFSIECTSHGRNAAVGVTVPIEYVEEKLSAH